MRSAERILAQRRRLQLGNSRNEKILSPANANLINAECAALSESALGGEETSRRGTASGCECVGNWQFHAETFSIFRNRTAAGPRIDRSLHSKLNTRAKRGNSDACVRPNATKCSQMCICFNFGFCEISQSYRPYKLTGQ